ncbi:Type 2 DNA topoisomerase 6 subunit A [Candidatus Methanoperedenaceae archaeon GB50]|nr:Type 2 DNA topoisomerase 6 subunit A [Candidatus Methanoperedenaceae archaeon GB50]CAD7773026.1 MAG: Type 2 DNA topoisomerase 6 subunit A [Candidatus Methanoperedenaceae archaeon GB50]
MQDRDSQARASLKEVIQTIYEQLEDGTIPYLQLPIRTKRNIELADEENVWTYGKNTITRSAKTTKGAYQLLKTTYLCELLIKDHLEQKKSSTLREIYYISENWKHAKFNEQQESDRLIEDLEIITGLRREDFHVRPEENGATIFGPLRLKETTKRGERIIHCQEDVGEAGYQIPYNVENIEFLEHDAQLIIAVETGGMQDRLIENGFDEKYNALLIHLKGQPARSTRRLIKRLNTELQLPVAVFTDGDPWSYRIYASVAYGAIKTAHLSEEMATPAAKFLGVQPRDIIEYNLSTDRLTNQDIKALHNELTDPRFNTPYWNEEIKLQLKLGKKAEQQAFAGKGLNYVTDTYLPARLTELGMIKR